MVGFFFRAGVPFADDVWVDFVYTHMDLNVLVNTVYFFLYLTRLIFYRSTAQVSFSLGTGSMSRVLKTH